MCLINSAIAPGMPNFIKFGRAGASRQYGENVHYESYISVICAQQSCIHFGMLKIAVYFYSH